jgi:CRISPR type III-A-associated protein Csm2
MKNKWQQTYKGKIFPTSQKEQSQKGDLKEKIADIKEKLKQINCFSDVSLRTITNPYDGWASLLANYFKSKFKITQLRKLFNEIKNTTKQAETDLEKAKQNLWRIYPIIAYAEARKLIPPDFAQILNEIIRKVDECEDPAKQRESFKRLEDFATALYAYFKKYDKGG